MVYRLSYVGWGAYALYIYIGIRALIRGYGTRMIQHVYIGIPALIRSYGMRIIVCICRHENIIYMRLCSYGMHIALYIFCASATVCLVYTL